MKLQTLNANISTPTSLAALDRNSTASGKQVDWRGSRIGATEGGAQTDPFRALRPFLKDSAGMDSTDRLHHRLDLLLAESGDHSETRSRALHTALDELIAKAAEDDSEPSEEDPDEQEPDEETDETEAEVVGADEDFRRLNRALADFSRAVRRSDVGSPSRSVGTGRSYAADADTALVGSYLRPEQSCQDALTTLQDSLYCKQKNPSKMSVWSGLAHYLQNQAPDASVRTCNASILAASIRELSQNLLAPGARTITGKTRLKSWGKGHIVN